MKKIKLRRCEKIVIAIVVIAFMMNLTLSIIDAKNTANDNKQGAVDGYFVQYSSVQIKPGDTLSSIVDEFYMDSVTSEYYTDTQLINWVAHQNHLHSKDIITSYGYLVMPYLTDENNTF